MIKSKGGFQKLIRALGAEIQWWLLVDIESSHPKHLILK